MKVVEVNGPQLRQAFEIKLCQLLDFVHDASFPYFSRE
jgi:hypothetical protein